MVCYRNNNYLFVISVIEIGDRLNCSGAVALAHGIVRQVF